MIRFNVEDMTCSHCVASVTQAIKEVDAAARVEIDLDAHRVDVESVLPAQELVAAIRAAGFTPAPA